MSKRSRLYFRLNFALKKLRDTDRYHIAEKVDTL